ncbi:hypothetical protein PGT21_030193 [Puccinia graminis f. sp. tritici]|uniref:Uncharacterized protein n=1 Tax=Puccinia graminis f. sp. tritici TaxID=56615 RepID=A0A5B0QJK0_PUCGR|nr:hypothetical protein PGT21_030193 [Puccinia graminis f. sp. tritici]
MTTGNSIWPRLLNHRVKTPLINKANTPPPFHHSTSPTSNPHHPYHSIKPRSHCLMADWRRKQPTHSGAPAPQSTSNAAVTAGVERLVWPSVMLESSLQSAPSSQSIPFHKHTPVSLSNTSSPSPVNIFKK